MKRCPACRRVYDRDAKFCQTDGTILADFNSDPLIGHTIAKRYRLVRRLGHGPLGAVYLAAELATGRSVAVKILVSELQCDDDVLKQCLWDARFATASRPSHIVRVYEVDRTDDGRAFIAMEYLEGETLSDLIQREGVLELGRALTLASQIARGVAAASRAGVSHRDLKPQNVMVMSPDERVKVTDFGVAWLRRAPKSGALTRLGDGATKYMAPEQWVGADADDRTDVYGIGAVLYAMLAGPGPSIARTRVVAGSDVRWEAPPLIRTARPDIPVSLEHFLARAMEREPERRHNGIDAFAEDLFNLTASIIETQTKEAGAREAPYVERGQAYREQWRARWPGYRARWQAERDRWQVWSRAQMSGATGAAARVANSASHALADKATGAAAGASRMVAGVTRTVGHGLAAVSRKAAGAATGASRVVATAAGTVAGAVGATARAVPLAVRSVGHGLADISRTGAGVATRASGTVMLATGTVAGAAAAAARTASVVSRAGARRLASASGVVTGAAGTVADSIARTSRTVSHAAIAAGHGLAGVSRAGAGAAMRGSRAVAVAAGTLAGAAASAVRAVPVVTRAGAHQVAPLARVTAAAAGAVTDAVVRASRTVPTVARAAGHGLASVSRAGAGAAMRASRAVVATGTVALAEAAGVAIRGSRAAVAAAGATAVEAAAVARAVPVVTRAGARRVAPVARVVAATAGAVTDAIVRAAGTVPTVARAAGHGLADVSRAGAGAAMRASRAVVATGTVALAAAAGAAMRASRAAVATAVEAAAAARAVPIVTRAGARRMAPVARGVAAAAGTVADAAVPAVARAAGHGLVGVSRVGAGAAMRASRAVGVATGTVAGAVAAGAGILGSRAVAVSVHTIVSAAAVTARAMAVVSRAAARRAALASRAVAGAAGAVAQSIAGASRAVPVAARVSRRGMGRVSRALADAATSVSRTVTGATRSAAGAVAAVVAGASRTIPVAARAVGRGLAPGSRAIAGAVAGMARAVAATPGMVAGAMAAAASRVAPVSTRAARHGMTGLSRARTGAVSGVSRAVTNVTGGLADATALAVRSHGAARQASALVRRRRDEGLRWMRANGRRLSLTSAAALVILGATTWGTVDWRPSFLRNTTAQESQSAVERGAIETESSVLDTTSPRGAGNKISRADTLARPSAPPAPAADDQNRSLPLQAARDERAGAESAASSLPIDTRYSPAGPRVAQLSSQQISRIQTQAEQTLRRRGLLRVSAADRWGVTLDTASNGEVTLAGVLRDMALYEEAVRLVREVPEVKAVRGTVEVSDVGTVPIVHSDSARIQVEIQQQLRSRGLLRESEADRWGVTVEVNPEGDVMLVGAVRDAEMYSEAVRRAREVTRVRQVRQDIKVMERDLQQ